MSGKLADTVMSVRNGEQIARKYQPLVFNPSTPLQIETRAKLKLSSQLSAVMSPVIAFAKKGAISSRNMFTKANYPALRYANNEAQVTLADIDLTGGIVSFPALSVSRENNNIEVALQSPAVGLDAVVYSAFAKMPDKSLRYAGSIKITEAGGSSMDYPGTLNVGTTGPIVVYGYGIRLNSESARTRYGSLIAEPSETIASLIATRSLLESDYSLTETRALEVAEVQANQNRVVTPTQSKKS